ncbi:MAG: HIT family protein [Candidatus Andersenbacteria bacterium]
MNCLSCQALKGEISLTPGPVIYEGTYWKVEHVNSSAIPGWLVIVLKRHAEALHELSTKELSELAIMQGATAKALHEELQSQKEYSVLFAEKGGCNHIHFHIVAIPEDLPADKRGANIFSLLNVSKTEAVAGEEIVSLCERLSAKVSASLTR